MYEQVCGHFKKDVNVGIDWLSVFALWKQSNPNAVAPRSQNTASVESGSPKKNKTPPPKKSNLHRPPNLRRVQTQAGGMGTNNNTQKDKPPPKSRLGKMGNLSPTKSTGNLMGKHRSNNSMSGSGSALTADNLS